ncbi:phage protein Gp36 family protein [Phreatobacter sp. HK31-P]
MPYATAADIVSLYTQELVDKIAWDEITEAVNTPAIERALSEAAAEIDTHLSGRYPIPIHPVPPILRKLNVDMAIYHVAFGYSRRTDEMRVRYDDALKMLLRIADGKAGLGIASTVATVDGEGNVIAGGNSPGTGINAFGSLKTRRAN